MRKDLESMLEKTMKGGDSIDELYSENSKIADELMFGVVTESFNEIKDVLSKNDKEAAFTYKGCSMIQIMLSFVDAGNGDQYDFSVISEHDPFKIRLIVLEESDLDGDREKIIWEGTKDDIGNISQELIIKEFIVYASRNNIFEVTDMKRVLGWPRLEPV